LGADSVLGVIPDELAPREVLFVLCAYFEGRMSRVVAFGRVASRHDKTPTHNQTLSDTSEMHH
jgi:hypothetical protein